jgi:hypothetical protein
VRVNLRTLVPTDRRTLALSVAAGALFVAVIVWGVPSGGGGASPTGAANPRVAETTAAKPAPSGKPVAPSRPTVKSRPPARLFAASESAPGVLIRVCEGGNCTALPQGNPTMITSKAGPLLTFTLAAHPTQAWVEIRGLPSGAPARETLSPNNLMSYQTRMTPGRYLVTLNAKFEASEARWVFGLKVSR